MDSVVSQPTSHLSEAASAMRSLFPVCWFFVVATGLGQSVSAQSTISDDPFEVTFGYGPMGLLLPSYQTGRKIAGGSAFRDDGDTLGVMGDLKAVRRFLGTRTSFETRGFYGLALANSTNNPADINANSPIDGADNFRSG